jgi:hypothetical protein
MATTNVPLPTFTSAGLLTYSEQAILTGSLADYVAAWAATGKTLSSALATPQGQLSSSQSYMVADFQAALAQLIANVDPLTASGAFQDALGRIYFLTRNAATYATVPATVTGVVGQPLATGAQVKSSDGTIWASTTSVVFGSAGTATVTFQATTAGSAPVAGINDLTIYQRSAGWEGVSNSVGSTPGQDVEGRAAFETRRQESVQIGGTGSAESVRAAVAAVANVSDVYVYNNGSTSAITYGTTGYPIPANSIMVAASGGTPAAVAAAIHSKLDAGCGMSSQGTTSVTIQDTVNYAAPYPTYVVRYVVPPSAQVYITVNVANLTTLPSNYITQVQQTVASAFINGYSAADGSINVSRARIGGQIIAAEYAAPLQTIGNITPVSIFIGFSANPTSGASVTMGIDQQPVCPALNITVNAITV